MKSFLASLLSVFGLCCCSAQDDVPVLAPADFVRAYEADSTAVLIDVRTPQEYAEGHLPHAINIDWRDTPAFAAATAKLDTNRPCYIYCRSGRRSNQAAHALQDDGFTVYDMQGGIIAYNSFQLEISK